ncbi:pentapeptide repeat-containing protein [Lentzea sp. NPDC102401]|uniref:pentapeptide repeat-containing protein n=1 Tax=Lentzea sp. NPDC102401 TaxID=3364128 RepID=UPI00382D686E
MDWLERVATVRTDPSTAINGKDFVAAKLDAVKIALSVVAGGGALFALYLGVRRQRTSERDLRARLDAQTHTEDDARARRVTELYTKAADQLGSDKAPVRLAGLYALERLGQEDPRQRATIAKLWCAYLRMPYTSPITGAPSSAGVARPLLSGSHRRLGPRRLDAGTAAAPVRKAGHAEAVLERDVRISVQRLLAHHLRPDLDDGAQPEYDYWPEILEIDLTEATLIDLDFSRCRLPALRMTRATLHDVATFRGTAFTHVAEFAKTTFNDGANFTGARFTGRADFGGATFHDLVSYSYAAFGDVAEFSGATFTRAKFARANFHENAKFADAAFHNEVSFANTTFENDASFNRAHFSGDAVFTNSTFRGNTGFPKAIFDRVAMFRRATLHGPISFGGVRFDGAARFAKARFLGDVGFTRTAFNGDAEFSGISFTTAVFDGVTFDSAVTFTNASFESAPKCRGVRLRRREADSSAFLRPQGWTEIDEDAVWGMLVPVPEVLDESHRWAVWLQRELINPISQDVDSAPVALEDSAHE